MVSSSERIFVSLREQASAIKKNNTRIRDLFNDDQKRFLRFSVTHDDLLLDFSRNLITPEVFQSLMRLARAANVEGWRSKKFAGSQINVTEKRSVLQEALRDFSEPQVPMCDEELRSSAMAELRSFTDFAEGVRSGQIRGKTNRAFRDVVNLGIGGSSIGPEAVTMALRPYHTGPSIHYVSNLDPAHIDDTMTALNPETTLFIVVSKSFNTMETMINAQAAQNWIAEHIGEDAIPHHFVGVSENVSKCASLGLAETRIFRFWDWVCGRCSVWSSAGLSSAIAIGKRYFMEFLSGGHAMDQHFLNQGLETNFPVILAVLGVWYRNVLGFTSRAIVPYDHRLARLVDHIQQLEMESNGKSVCRNGSITPFVTGPVTWGGTGTDCQHSFFQFLHQGTDVVPVDFLIAAEPHRGDPIQHSKLVASCIAQSQALMCGTGPSEVGQDFVQKEPHEETMHMTSPHEMCPGNRPSNVLMYKRLDPYTLGRLIALYEHRSFVQGVIWNINSFDQFGVELGKHLTDNLVSSITDTCNIENIDVSITGLVQHYHKLRSELG